jgi:hypothetical protein
VRVRARACVWVHACVCTMHLIVHGLCRGVRRPKASANQRRELRPRPVGTQSSHSPRAVRTALKRHTTLPVPPQTDKHRHRGKPLRPCRYDWRPQRVLVPARVRQRTQASRTKQTRGYGGCVRTRHVQSVRCPPPPQRAAARRGALPAATAASERPTFRFRFNHGLPNSGAGRGGAGRGGAGRGGAGRGA